MGRVHDRQTTCWNSPERCGGDPSVRAELSYCSATYSPVSRVASVERSWSGGGGGPTQFEGRRLVPRRCAFWRVTASCRSGPFWANAVTATPAEGSWAGQRVVAEHMKYIPLVRAGAWRCALVLVVPGTPNPHAVSGFRVREGQSVAKRRVKRHHFAPRSPKRTQKASNSISPRPVSLPKVSREPQSASQARTHASVAQSH